MYEEDFTGIDDGLVPKHWAGAQHVLVKTIGRNKYLCPFEKGEYKIVIPELNIPWGDFKIEWLCHYSPKNYSTAGETEFTITIGNVCAGIAYTTWGSKGVWINGTQEKFGDVNDKVFLMCLEKRGDVWRLFIDGTQSILARVQSFQRSNTIVLDFKDHPFYLSWIRVLALEG